MITNRERYFEPDGTIRPEALENNPWLRILYEGEELYWNAERIGNMAEKAQNHALAYTLRTLDILDSKHILTQENYDLIRTVLCWSETAKGGTKQERLRWQKRGYPLAIHNEASARIYADHVFVKDQDTDPVCILIRTHGLAGQFIRGECRMASSRPLALLRKGRNEQEFLELITVLNECIIRAVSEDIWTSVQKHVRAFAGMVWTDVYREYFPQERLRRLLPHSAYPTEDTRLFFAEEIFPKYDLWYFESALGSFGCEGAAKFCRMALSAVNEQTRHLVFKPLADELYYDLEGRKHINTYKQRIIERWLEDPSTYSQHVRAVIECHGSLVTIGVRFTPVCEKLIDFCVEAERSGLLTYEKSITMLYDMFGFRRDAFDRLNNEEQYLKTMNAADTSTKKDLPEYVTGDRILDVGSGGGVLLDKLEARWPEKTIIGTDISQNVIEVLEKKKQSEKHSWSVCVHNFSDSVFTPSVDTVIFSSILHEIYSYTETPQGRFNIASVEKALHNAAASLNNGGRIVIRDGIKTPGNARLGIRFKTAEGMEFFKRFMQDFHGMDAMDETQRIVSTDDETNTVVTDINYGREFLYTYTWGAASFAHECQECFGYYTLPEYREALKAAGLHVIRAESFLEPGYEEHLSPLVELFDPDTGDAVRFPDSNCILIAEK